MIIEQTNQLSKKLFTELTDYIIRIDFFKNLYFLLE